MTTQTNTIKDLTMKSLNKLLKELRQTLENQNVIIKQMNYPDREILKVCVAKEIMRLRQNE